MRAGLSRIWQEIKYQVRRFANSRMLVIAVFFCILTAVLIQRLFVLQIVDGQEYADNYKLQIQKTKDVEATRGNIYDRNGNLLAYNELAYAVTIEDSGEYASTKEKNEELNEIITTVIEIVERNGDTVINDFKIVVDDDGNYAFTTTSNTQRLRFIADIYGLTTIDQLTQAQQNATPDDIIEYLCTDSTYGYGIDMELMTKEEVLKLVNVRYAISLNSYQKYIETTIAEDVSDETVSEIMENVDTLQGVEIAEQSMRRYNYSLYTANVVGYTGKISQEEYEALSEEEQENYSLTDTIGKDGIEKSMDSILKGQRGSEKIYVNNVGKVIESAEVTKAVAGNDVYLTIDAELQKAAYELLEQELAGIILSHLVDELDFDRTSVTDTSKIMIPAGDVYNALIENNILDMGHFSDPDAGSNEKAVYQAYTEYKSAVLDQLRNLLEDPNGAAYQNLSKEWQAYMTYIITDFLRNSENVIMADEINTSDETYQAWHTDESINVYTYLTHAISQNWIDTGKLTDYLPEQDAYSDSSEIYEALVAYTVDTLSSDTDFNKMIYKYMIKAGTITGEQICMILYEQGVMSTGDAEYEGLTSGDLTAYDFIKTKIQNLELTPGDLALEPCSGSVVVTDPNSGEVLACVSYPGFDNNKLANNMDAAYYNKLVNDGSSPLFNKATQEKTAPGSTYKPMVAVAGLLEGTITTQTTFTCTGVFTEVDTPHRCWAYPSAHGELDLAGAIENSCNYYFYSVGYEMSTTVTRDKAGNESVTYSSKKGTDTLQKYAEMFGLGEKSGVEITESEPQISDESSVPSAIGQGNNNFTTTQLARYVTAIANRGTVYKLTLLDQITTPSGDLVEKNEPVVTNTIDGITNAEWEAIDDGMRRVVTVAHYSIFDSLNYGTEDVELYGKTGTAQQSSTHPDHGLFIGFAPNEDNPDMAMAVRIANGYTSSRAAEVGRDITKYFYQTTDLSNLLTGTAASMGTSESAGD